MGLIRFLVRAIRWGLWLVAGLLVSLFALLVLVMGTDTGTRLTIEKGLSFLPAAEVGQIDGTLWRGLRLQDIHYDDGAGTVASLREARLAVSWPALLGWRLHVEQVGVSGLELRLPESEPAPPSGEPFDLEALLPALPIALRVDALRLRDVAVLPAPDGEWIRLDSLDAALGADRFRASLDHLALSLSAPVAVELEAEASLDMQAPHAVDARLSGSLAVEEGELDWRLTAAGTLDALGSDGELWWRGVETPDARVELALRSSLESARIQRLLIETLDGRLDLDGELDWARGLDWRLRAQGAGLDLSPLAEIVTGPLDFELESRGGLKPDGALSHDSRLLQAALEIDGIGMEDLSLHVSGDQYQARLHELSLSLLGGLVSLDGQFGWRDRLDWALDMAIRDIEPESVVPVLDGPLSLALQSRGHFDLENGALSHDSRLSQGRLTVAQVAITELAAHVSGSLEATELHGLSLSLLDGSLHLEGEGGLKDSQAHWQLAARGDGLLPEPLVAALDGPVAFRLDSRGEFDLDAMTLAHHTRLHDAGLTVTGIPISELELRVDGGLEQARIEALSAALLDGRLSADGRAGWGEAVDWSLNLRGEGLNPGALAEAAAGELAFALQSEGQLDPEGALSHRSRLDALNGEVAGVPIEDLGLTVAGSLETVTVSELAGVVLGATLSGGAEVNLDDARIGWVASLSLDQAELSRLGQFDIDAGIDGWLGLDLASEGQWRDGEVDLGASLTNLRGELGGETLSGEVLARLKGETLRVDPASILLGENRLWLTGQLTPPFDLRFRLDLPALARLPVPAELGLALAGELDGEGHVRGTLEAPDMQAVLRGRGLVVADARLETLDVDARVDSEQLSLAASLAGIAVGDQHVESVALKADGRLSRHALSLDARSDFGGLRLGLEGGLDAQTWRGRLTGLDLIDTDAGNWALAAPAALTLGAEALSLDTACLRQIPRETTGRARPDRQPGELCVEGRRIGEAPLRAALDARLPLSLARPVLPPNLRLPGELTLKAEAELGERMQVDARLALPDNQVIASGWTEEPLRIDYRDIHAELSLRDQRLEVALGAALPGYLSLDGRLRGALDDSLPLDGRIRLDMPDMGWLNMFAPAITELEGEAHGEITLAGALAEPRPGGWFEIANLAMNLPDTGVAYRDGQFRLDIDPAQQLAIDGQLAGVTGGVLHIGGKGDLSALPDWRLSVSVDGEDMPVLRTNELIVDASPALTVEADQALADVRGRVLLPRVEARVHGLPEGSVGESGDLVIAGHETDHASAYALRTDIEIILGETVTLEGMGFSAGLAGQLRLRGDEGAPIAAFGEVDIKEGRYAAYGQDLRIDRGRLTFNGPLDDPGLDVRASRTVDEFQAGLDITGTLNNPRSQVFSVPALSESDALSLLLTGRRLSAGTSGADANLLVNALAGLGIAQGDDIARDIGQAVGFDELGLDTENGLEGAQVTVGKRINSRLLVRYVVGVFDGVGKFITEYDINRFLDLEITSSAESQGADLIYRIER